MATPKKKHLIELMIEAGVKWPEGAEYAAQDKSTHRVHFYEGGKPLLYSGWSVWAADECEFLGDEYGVLLPSLCRNWHQTIVTREQYEEAMALAANVSDTPVDEVKWHNPPSIEQLTSNYYAKAAEADRLQAVADEALKAADDALLALEKAGELIRLVISIDTKSKQVERPVEPMQPIITDWRDLRVGDVVECIDYELDKEGVIIEIDHGDEVQPIKVNRYQTGTAWPRSWRFIRRP